MLDEGKLEADKEIFCLLLNFPGKFRRQKRTSLPLIGELYLIENHRHNYGQCLTTPSQFLPVLIPQYLEHSMSQFRNAQSIMVV